MPPFDPPQPPEPVDPPNPPGLDVPLPPPEVGFGSPWAPADAENRDRILDWWRAWWRSVFFPWIGRWSTYWNDWRAAFLAYIDSWLSYAGDYIESHAVAGYSWRKTSTPLNAVGSTTVEIVPFDELRPILVGDLVSDASAMSRYGQVTAVVDDTHATVLTLGSLRGIEGHSWWSTVTPIANVGTTAVVLPVDADPNRLPQIGDLVSDQSEDTNYGRVTVVTDATHVTVTYLGSLRGAVGPQGGPGPQGDPGIVQSIVPGANVTVDDTDPANPIVSATGGGGSGIVESVVAGDNVIVDDTDPANPVVSADPGIPLDVYPTSGRPAALIDGDAYFDSTLLIPVWSYGGVWRDSDGTQIPDPDAPYIIEDPETETGGGQAVVVIGGVTGYDPIGPGTGLELNMFSTPSYGGRVYIPTYSDPDIALAHTADGVSWGTINYTDIGVSSPSGAWIVGLCVRAGKLLAFVENNADSMYAAEFDGSSWSPVSLHSTVSDEPGRSVYLTESDELYILRGSEIYYAASISGAASQVVTDAIDPIDIVGGGFGDDFYSVSQSTGNVARIVSGSVVDADYLTGSGSALLITVPDIEGRSAGYIHFQNTVDGTYYGDGFSRAMEITDAGYSGNYDAYMLAQNSPDYVYRVVAYNPEPIGTAGIMQVKAKFRLSAPGSDDFSVLGAFRTASGMLHAVVFRYIGGVSYFDAVHIIANITPA